MARTLGSRAMHLETGKNMRSDIDIVPAYSLTQADKDAILQLCDRAYEQDLSLIFAAFREPLHFIIRDTSQIIAHACLIERTLQVAESSPMRTAFVEAVATDPIYQGRGLGSALMKRMMLEAEEAQFEIGGLSTGRFDYYRHLGWELWRGPLGYRLEGQFVSTPEENGAMIYRLTRTPQLDLDQRLSVEWRSGPEIW